MKNLFLLFSLIFFSFASFSQNCQQINVTISSSAVLETTSPQLQYSVADYASFSLTATGIYSENGLNYTQSDSLSVFVWTFGDGYADTGTCVTHAYSAPGIFPVNLTVIDTNNCSFDTLLYIYSSPSFNVNYWGSSDTLEVGDTLFLDGSVNANEMSFVDEIIYLPDGSGVSYTTSVMFDDFAPGATIESLNDLFSINAIMEHSFLGDLTMFITCPNNTMVQLEDQGGGNTYLGIPDEADTPLPIGIGWEYSWALNPTYGVMSEEGDATTAASLPAGSYASFQPLTNLIGCPMNGEWTITITDNWTVDNGYIFGWYLNLNYINLFFPPSLSSWSSAAKSDVIIDNPNNGSAKVVLSTPGTHEYTFTAINNAGFSQSKTITVNVKESTVNVEETLKNNITYNAYPNPFTENLFIEYTLDIPANVKVEVYNVIGNEVKTIVSENQQAGNYKYSYGEKDLENGLYIVKYTIGSKTYTKKVFKN